MAGVKPTILKLLFVIRHYPGLFLPIIRHYPGLFSLVSLRRLGLLALSGLTSARVVASPALLGFYRLVLSGLGFVFSGRLPVRLFAWTLTLLPRAVADHLSGGLVVLAVFPAGTRIVGSLLGSAVFGSIVGELVCPAVL